MSESKPLDGKRIAVTRAIHQAPPLAALIREAGGLPVSYPCIAIAPASDRRPLENRLRRLSEFDWLLLTSGNSVRAIAEALSTFHLQVADANIQVAAAGPATAAEARLRLACETQHVPAEFGALQLARSLPLSQPCRVLLPQSDRAGAAAAQLLRARGADVTTVIAYQTIMGEGGADLPAMIRSGEIDALAFASPSAVAFFRRRCPLPAATQLPAACIGPATSAAARAAGFARVITPRQPAISDMIDALAVFCASSSATG